jgi:alcohol dehydrogenase (cytochrome c)
MPVLIDAPFRGQPRKLLVQANRNGYYYVLDRNDRDDFSTARRSSASSAGRAGLSPEGRPILTPGTEPSVLGAKTCPSTMGATNWPSPAYNPDTGYSTSCAGRLQRQLPRQRSTWRNRRWLHSQSEGGRRVAVLLRALDATTGKKVWEYQHIGSLRYGPGILSTAGGLVFAGGAQRTVHRVDARTGKPVWHIQHGALITRRRRFPIASTASSSSRLFRVRPSWPLRSPIRCTIGVNS